MRRTTVAAMAVLAVTRVFADPATGWKMTGAGPYRYGDAANWVDGEVNGVFGSDLALAADQTVVFDEDASINGLTIAFSGNHALAFTSDGSARTLTLGGETSVNVADGAKVSFGAADDALALVLSAGTVFAVERGTLEAAAKISGTGGFTVAGGDPYNSTFLISNPANDFSGTLVISGGKRSCHTCFNAAGALPVSGVSIRILDGGVLRGCSAAGYSCAWYASSGVLAADSSGTLAIGDNESADIDLSGYPSIAFGSSGGNYTFGGALTPANGCYRIRTTGSHLYFSKPNALSGDNDVVIEHQTQSQSVYVQASNNLTGTIRVRGGGFVLHGANGAVPNADIVMCDESQLLLQDSKNTGKTVARNLTLRASTFSVSGNTSYDVEHVITGALKVDGTHGGCSFVKMTSNASKAVSLRASRLEMPVPAVLGVDGGGLGAAPGANACNIFFDEAPALSGGGGAAGSTTISILPRVEGSATAGGSSPNQYVQSFVTYESSVGMRPLNLATEYESTIPASSASANVRLPFGSAVEMSSAATVNAVIFQGAASGTPVEQLKAAEGTENVKLSVTSGQVILGQRKGGAGTDYSSVPFDFGGATGVVWNEHDKTQYFKSALSGSGGLVCAQAITRSTSGKATQLQGDSSGLSGDVWIMGEGMLGTDFISGLIGRTGDVVVPSGAKLIHNLNTRVEGYRLHVDGAFTVAAVTVADGGILSGIGSFTRKATLEGGAKVESGSSYAEFEDVTLDFNGGLQVSGSTELVLRRIDEATIASAFVNGGVTVDAGASMSVSVSPGNWSGEHLLFSSTEAIPRSLFVRGGNCGKLEVRDGCSLWMTPPGGMFLIFR